VRGDGERDDADGERDDRERDDYGDGEGTVTARGR
jgi:hypothetical protein